MAFVNEFLTREERAEFAAKAIKNPGNMLTALEATRWTIDREKNIFLIWGFQERKETYDYYFLLGWNNIPISVRLSKTWIDRETCEWKLFYIKLPDDLKEKTGEIIQSLKDALSVYGFNGSPDEPFDSFNKTIKVQFGF
ncbi:MAG TPA: hypothetical protein DCK76_02510 [Desulfotomaculum sp.]|nr:MAG: Uncharacterized protein XD84_1679 [Desulfotomaculum sp. 46_80]HAG10268.1 hypothetical protein [Desulfotomaculum sp.]HBY03328.1 hypothetical protein [Desulfotomaculum sp.]